MNFAYDWLLGLPFEYKCHDIVERVYAAGWMLSLDVDIDLGSTFMYSTLTITRIIVKLRHVREHLE